MKSIFITGATGFVGSHTARLLLQDNWQVRALVRRLDRKGLLPDGVEPVVGDLLRPETYAAALGGCQAVVHVAGLVKARTEAAYLEVNAGGAGAVARVAGERCPEAMFVLVSSQAAAGPSPDGRPVHEADPPRPVSQYGRSKLAGERAVQKIYPGPWCVVRPCAVYGPGDPGVLELFKTVQRGVAPLPAGGRGLIQLIAVEDLARVIVAAASRPDLRGRIGFAAHETVRVAELIDEIASFRRKRPWRVPVPAWAVRAAGLWESVRQGITRSARPFNRDKAREMLQPCWLCDAEPLLRDLGISELTPWRAGLRRTCRCYVEAGWLRADVWAV